MSHPSKGRDPVRASDVSVQKVKFLWHPYLPTGKLVFLDGDPGSGKSQVALDIAARVSTGEPFQGHKPDVKREPRAVIVFTREDDPEDTVVPRLMAAEANLTRVLIDDRPFDLGKHEDMSDLVALVGEEEASLVVFDTISGYLGSKVDVFRDNQVRPVFDSLAVLARKTNTTILLLRHIVKGDRSKALYLGSGSIALNGVARSVLLVASDPNRPDRRALFHIKHNLTRKVDPLGYTFAEVSISGAGRQSRIQWIGASDMTMEDVFALEGREAANKTKTQMATEALINLLGKGEPVPASNIEAVASAMGVSMRTFESVKKRLGIESVKVKDRWFWQMTNANVAEVLERIINRPDAEEAV